MAEPLSTSTAAPDLSGRMDRLEKKMIGFESQIAENTKLTLENTEITRETKADTGEFLEIFKAMRGGFKVLGWLGTAAKWTASLGAALIGLYYAVKMGPKP